MRSPIPALPILQRCPQLHSHRVEAGRTPVDEAARKAVELDDSLPEAHSRSPFGLANEWEMEKKRSPNFAVPLP